MEITKVKYWSKVVQTETVDHIRIAYSEDDSEMSLHKFGDKAVAAPEFYAAFENFSPVICKTLGVDESLANAISLREISISQSEDKEGNDNTSYSLVCGLKSGHATTELKISINHKYIPEGFKEAVQDIIDEAEEYISGKRSQTELELEPDSED